MVAPNGARRGKADHPALPVTIAETVRAAVSCYEAGAGAIHAHVRDAEGRHVLDAGLYRELIGELASAVPDMAVQITTEAVGRYSPADQRELVRDVMPAHVSVALREMLPDDGERVASRDFYHWAADAGMKVQHILYEAADLASLFSLIGEGVIPAGSLQVLFVLGRYTEGQQSEVADMDPFLAELGLRDGIEEVDWALCAFGRNETDCLVEAIRRGGKARIGFENNLLNRDGLVATDNAERVRELVAAIR
nr:3-keto-5-aminohexanoate cleavage protein [Hoeflea prorocentri]